MKWWIDKEDFNDARLELEVVSPGSRMQQGSKISMMTRLLDEGVWVMSEMRFDFNLRFFKVAGGRGTVLTTHSDFHRFEVSSRVVDAPQ